MEGIRLCSIATAFASGDSLDKSIAAELVLQSLQLRQLFAEMLPITKPEPEGRTEGAREEQGTQAGQLAPQMQLLLLEGRAPIRKLDEHAISRLLTDPRPTHREHACLALASIGDIGLAQRTRLLRCLDDSDRYARAAAALASRLMDLPIPQRAAERSNNNRFCHLVSTSTAEPTPASDGSVRSGNLAALPAAQRQALELTRIHALRIARSANEP